MKTHREAMKISGRFVGDALGRGRVESTDRSKETGLLWVKDKDELTGMPRGNGNVQCAQRFSLNPINSHSTMKVNIP